MEFTDEQKIEIGLYYWGDVKLDQSNNKASIKLIIDELEKNSSKKITTPDEFFKDYTPTEIIETFMDNSCLKNTDYDSVVDYIAVENEKILDGNNNICWLIEDTFDKTELGKAAYKACVEFDDIESVFKEIQEENAFDSEVATIEI
jgi:hypothetical protein